MSYSLLKKVMLTSLSLSSVRPVVTFCSLSKSLVAKLLVLSIFLETMFSSILFLYLTFHLLAFARAFEIAKALGSAKAFKKTTIVEETTKHFACTRVKAMCKPLWRAACCLVDCWSDGWTGLVAPLMASVGRPNVMTSGVMLLSDESMTWEHSRALRRDDHWYR